MKPARLRTGAWVALGVCVFAGASWVIFQGYLTPDMALYFLSFKWCF